MNSNRRLFLIDSTTMLTLFGFGFFPASVMANRKEKSWQHTAENGAYVGIGIESSIPNIDAIAFLVDKNPSVLSGYFEIKKLEKLKLGTKIKMAETSDLVALVKAGDQYFMNTRHVKVVLGGCGS